MNVIEALKDNLCYIVVSLFVLLSLFCLLSSRVHMCAWFYCLCSVCYHHVYTCHCLFPLVLLEPVFTFDSCTGYLLNMYMYYKVTSKLVT